MQKYATTRLKTQLQKIGWIMTAWTIISILQFYFGYNVLKQFDCVPQGQPISNYIITNILMSLL
ncbi:MAG: hypothetical protein L6Q97_22755, partial [Thermoanaerobaculia bacterium]|nr:hypothetical protein [Thermoanaerobaculia bacterium]